MQQAAEEAVFKGMTAAQLTAAYDVFGTIPNVEGYMQETGALHAQAAADCPPAATDVAYGPSEIEKLDIYAPSGAPKNTSGAPVLIDVHGGGWTMGSKNTRAVPAPAITGAGVLWVPIDYGLAPDHKMDQIVDHVRRAVAWVHANIAQYGGDPDRVFVSGNSAGGYLTGSTLMPGWHAEYGLPEDGIKGACAMSGVFDLDPIVLSSQGPNDALKMSLEDAARLSPIKNLPDAGCPIVISYGAPELDSFIGQSNDFAAAWTAKGFSAETVVVPEAHHMAMSRELANPDGALFAAVMKLVGA